MGAGQAAATADEATTAAGAAAAIFDRHRARLQGIAYRMLGSVADAEDTVQDAWLRWSEADHATIAEPRAFLITITTRLALDRLRRARTAREAYIGTWLPEPILTAPDIAEGVERAESVSLALLVVLETLSPLERAVFILREAFGYSHAEIAAIIGRGEAATRQLARRARDHVEERRPRFTTDRAMRARVTERFVNACMEGDIAGLLGVLAPEVTLLADGGGEALAPRRPVDGAPRVARFLEAMVSPRRAALFLASLGLGPETDLQIALAPINGEPALVALAGERPVTVALVAVADEAVQAIYLLANPRKLAALPLGEAAWGARRDPRWNGPAG